MLAASRHGARALGARRGFASVVDAAGVKVAAHDAGQPTASVTLLAKAGSRYASAPGVAHALKNFAFKVCVVFWLFGMGGRGRRASEVDGADGTDFRARCAPCITAHALFFPIFSVCGEFARSLKCYPYRQSTAKRSALGTVRETELYGGVLSTTLTREHLAVTAEFLKGDE